MTHSKDRIYGEWAISNQPLPSMGADHILGARVLHDRDGRPDRVEIQWKTADGDVLQQVHMDFVNAMFLLSVLKSAQLDSGYPFPDDPRAPSDR